MNPQFPCSSYFVYPHQSLENFSLPPPAKPIESTTSHSSRSNPSPVKEYVPTKNERGIDCYFKALALPKDGVFVEGDVRMTKVELLLEAYRLGVRSPELYCALGDSVCGTIVLPFETRSVTHLDLYARSITEHPSYSQAYCLLAAHLENMATYSIQSIPWSAKKLYIRALGLNPNIAVAYHSLALLMHKGEIVHIGAFPYNRLQLIVKAIQMMPRELTFLLDAALIHYDECPGVAVFVNGLWHMPTNFLAEAIKWHPNEAQLYYYLGCMLGKECVCRLHDGFIWNQKQLLAKASILNPDCVDPAKKLVDLIGVEEQINLPGGRTVRAFEIFYMVATRTPENPLYLCRLAKSLVNNEKVWFEGKYYSKVDLLLRATKLGPKDEELIQEIEEAIPRSLKRKYLSQSSE